MSSDTVLTYRCAPGVVWVKDAGRTILVSADTGSSWLLSGWQAAVWDLLCLGYQNAGIVRALALLLDLPPETARKRLRAILDEWEVNGMVSAAVEGNRG